MARKVEWCGIVVNGKLLKLHELEINLCLPDEKIHNLMTAANSSVLFELGLIITGFYSSRLQNIKMTVVKNILKNLGTFWKMKYSENLY